MAISKLRQNIQEAITHANGDNEKAALNVCAVIEDMIGLEGNGWFDGDKEVLKAISDFYDNR
jgi:hypothetical protein